MGIWPGAGKGADALIQFKAGENFQSVLPEKGKALLSCGAVGMGERPPGRAQQQVSLCGGNGGNALAVLCVLMEDDAAGFFRPLVQHQKIRTVTEKAHTGGKEHFLHPVRSNTGAVYHAAAKNLLIFAYEKIAAVAFFNVDKLAAKERLTAVGSGVFPCGNAKLPWVHGAGAGSVKGKADVWREHRLHLKCLSCADKLKPGHFVFPARIKFFA